MRRLLLDTECLTGLAFVILGGCFFVISRNYAFGTASEMGPGFFPRVLSIGVVLIGIAQFLKGATGALKNDGDALNIHARPAIFVLGSMAVFAFALRPLGLVVASLLLVAIAGVVAPGRRLKEIAIMAIVLALFSAIVFVEALGVVMPLWPRGF